jgi:hypothetical protein
VSACPTGYRYTAAAEASVPVIIPYVIVFMRQSPS